MSASAGVQAAIETYRRDALVPSGARSLSPAVESDWDTYEARLWRYHHYDLYYFNTVFSQLDRYARQHLKDDDLYRYTRGIFNPVWRLVNITVAKCYGGNLDWQTLRTGAVPLEGLDDELTAAIRQLWKWSNWAQLKMRYARFLARYGDGVLKVVDDPARGRVRLEVLHPGVVREADIDAVGYVKRIVIEYERDDPEKEGESCLYREVITQEEFATYRVKHGEAALYPWHSDPRGNPREKWRNPYGFVPVALAQAADVGRQWGATTFHGGTLSKLDALNDLASLVFDHMRQTVDAMWYIAGARSIEELDVQEPEDENAERSTVQVMTGPEGSQPYPMVANIDFSGALEHIKTMLDEIRDDCPELSFADLREFQLNSSPAVRLALGDAIDRLTEFNGNADAALLRAFQMAITVGGIGGYANFEPFGVGDYEAGNLDFQIKPRDIVPDELSKREVLELWRDTEAPPRWIWEATGRSAEEIAEAEIEAFEREREVAADVARALATGVADAEGA